jgi:hypothetical protein
MPNFIVERAYHIFSPERLLTFIQTSTIKGDTPVRDDGKASLPKGSAGGQSNENGSQHGSTVEEALMQKVFLRLTVDHTTVSLPFFLLFEILHVIQPCKIVLYMLPIAATVPPGRNAKKSSANCRNRL